MVTVDLSSYADGETHLITFRASFAAGEGASFYVDDVCLTLADVYESLAEAWLAGFAAGDIDDSDTLSLDEAQTVWNTLSDAAFAVLDGNGDGALSRAELEAFVPDDPRPIKPLGCAGGGIDARRGWGDWGLGLALFTGLFAMGRRRRQRHG